MKVSVLDENELEANGYTGLSSVGKGSIHPPRLITLEYTLRSSKFRQAGLGGERNYV